MTDSPASPAPQSAPRPPRWRRRLLIGVATLLVLVLLAPLALSLPPVRSMIADKIGAKLDRRVEIGKASAFWFQGIDLEDITIHSPEGFDGPLATVRKIHADVDVLGALAGGLEAKVRVVEPHVTFRRNSAGVSNADGVAEALQGEDDPQDTSSDASGRDIRVVVIGGKVESLGAQGTAEAALHELDIGLALRPSGGLGLDLKCVATEAATTGGSARIAAAVDLRADGSMPFTIDIPGLDLARLARLLQDATGVTDVAGSLEVTGKGERSATGTLDGTVQAKALGLRVRTGAGMLVSLQRMLVDATLRTIQDATDVDAKVEIGDLRVEDPATSGRPYREPSVTLAAQARVHPKGWVRIAKAHLDAGRTAKVTMAEVFKLQLEPEVRFDGKLAIEADLGRLGTLGALAPALEPLGGGRLSAQVQGTGDRGFEMGIGAAITNLSLRPSEDFPQGYTEPSIRATLRLNRSDEEGSTLRLYSVASRLLTLTTRDAKEGVALGLDREERFWMDGGFDSQIDLTSLTRLLAAHLPLEPGERVAGTLVLGGTGRGQGDTMQATTDVRMQNVLVPPSWSEVRTPANLTARVALRRDRRTTTAEVTDLAGMGLSGELSARLRAGSDGSALDNVEGQINLDLQAARSWLGALAGLDPQARLAGVARSRVRLAGEDAGQRLDASVQITNLVYQPAPRAARLQEPRVNLRVNAWLAPEGGRHRADELKITAAALTIDASGSTYVASPDTDMDLAIQLAGDAAKLAPTLAALLGEGYEDLRGEGRLSGRFRATGSADDDAANLLVDGNAVLGSWSTSGLEVGDLKATLARASSEEPLSLGLTSKLNKGRLFSQGAMTLGTPQYPWKGQLDVSDVDTSGVVTSQGFGRLLAFALPALLPAGANVPVLSGLLTARVEAEAPSLEDPAMLDGLTGRGRVSMTQGSIKNSTLFGGGSGGGQLGKIIQGLKLAVPEAGRVLERATKALTFSSLESKFRIAQRVVHVDRAKLSGTSLDVDMQGTVQFDKRVALASKLVLLGSAGKKVAKVLPGGAIPLRIGGTLASPQVRPDVDMGKLLAGAVGDPGDLLDRLKKKGLPKIKNPFK